MKKLSMVFIMCLIFVSPLVNAKSYYSTSSYYKKLNYKTLLESSVMISGTMTDNSCQNPNPMKYCSGSGVIISYNSKTNKSIVLTNKHVAKRDYKNGCYPLIITNSNEVHQGKVLKVSDTTDLAAIEVEGFINKPVDVSKKETKLFDQVVNFSSSQCIQNVISLGQIVSKDGNILGTPADTAYLGVDFGSSGSPVYNISGKLVGLIFSMTNIKIPIAHLVTLKDINAFLKEVR